MGKRKYKAIVDVDNFKIHEEGKIVTYNKDDIFTATRKSLITNLITLKKLRKYGSN